MRHYMKFPGWSAVFTAHTKKDLSSCKEKIPAKSSFTAVSSCLLCKIPSCVGRHCSSVVGYCRKLIDTAASGPRPGTGKILSLPTEGSFAKGGNGWQDSTKIIFFFSKLTIS